MRRLVVTLTLLATFAALPAASTLCAAICAGAARVRAQADTQPACHAEPGARGQVHVSAAQEACGSHAAEGLDGFAALRAGRADDLSVTRVAVRAESSAPGTMRALSPSSPLAARGSPPDVRATSGALPALRI
jgi:hypothetical protein